MKGWRTITANIVAALPLVAQYVVEMGADQAFLDALPNGWGEWYALIVIGANIYLRTITTTPWGRRE